MNQAQEVLKTIRPDAAPAPEKAAVTLKLTPIRNGAPRSGGYLDVLVEAFAADLAVKKALPLNLAFVIDRSGSMRGKPLAEAKACVKDMIRKMKPTDRAAVVVYDDRIDTVIGSMTVAEMRTILDARLDAIGDRGNTNLHGGWLAGAEQAAPGSGAHALSRIILLSDGQANAGIQNIAEIASQARKMADAGVTTSTYGLGNSFNEELMTEIAAQGNGSAYYGESAEDLMPRFVAEFDALAATVGRDASLASAPQAECINGFRTHPNGGALIPNLVAGAASWAILRFPLTEQVSAHKVGVTLSWTDENGKPMTLSQSLEVLALEDALAAALPEDRVVSERLRELEATGIQKRAKAAADRHDWNGVEDAIVELQGMAGDNAYVAGVAQTLKDLAARRDSAVFGKEAMFASMSMTRGYTSFSMDPSSLQDEAAPSFAKRSARQGK